MLQTALTQIVPTVLTKILQLIGLTKGTNTYTNIGMVLSIILYSLIFLLPAFFIWCYTPRTETQISSKIQFTKRPVFVTLGALGVIALAGLLTNIIQIFFEQVGIGFTTPDIYVPKNIVGIILFAIYTAVIPAIVEEILFRKVILNALLPYGSLFAIIFSAALFSLMHCNPNQTLYTFIGGLILAAVAVETKSVILPICIHFFNNLLSVGYMLLYTFASEKVYMLTASTIDTLLKLFGIYFLHTLIKNKFFSSNKLERPNTDFSIIKYSIRVLFILYIFYTTLLAMKWVYTI